MHCIDKVSFSIPFFYGSRTKLKIGFRNRIAAAIVAVPAAFAQIYSKTSPWHSQPQIFVLSNFGDRGSRRVVLALLLVGVSFLHERTKTEIDHSCIFPFHSIITQSLPFSIFYETYLKRMLNNISSTKIT